MPLASGKCFFDEEFEISFRFICGNERMNDLNSHGKEIYGPTAAEGRVEHTQGAAGFPWRADVSEHLPGVAVS